MRFKLHVLYIRLDVIDIMTSLETVYNPNPNFY